MWARSLAWEGSTANWKEEAALSPPFFNEIVVVILTKWDFKSISLLTSSLINDASDMANSDRASKNILPPTMFPLI